MVHRTLFRGVTFAACTGKGKALAAAGVPDSMAKQFPAGDWLRGPLEVLGGRGGGKPNMAQGQGPNLDKLADAMRVAEEFAAAKL